MVTIDGFKNAAHGLVRRYLPDWISISPHIVDRAQLDRVFRMNEIGYYATLMAFDRVEASLALSNGDRARVYAERQNNAAYYPWVNRLLGLNPQDAVRMNSTMDQIDFETAGHIYDHMKTSARMTVIDGTRFMRSATGLGNDGVQNSWIANGPQINFTQYLSGKDAVRKFALTIADQVSMSSIRSGVRPSDFAIDGETRDWEAPYATLKIDRIVINGMRIFLCPANIATALCYAEKLTHQVFDGKGYDPAKALREALAEVPDHRLGHLQPRVKSQDPRPNQA